MYSKYSAQKHMTKIFLERKWISYSDFIGYLPNYKIKALSQGLLCINPTLIYTENHYSNSHFCVGLFIIMKVVVQIFTNFIGSRFILSAMSPTLT